MDYEIVDRINGEQIEVGDNLIVEGNQIVVRTVDDDYVSFIRITAENLSDATGDTDFEIDPFESYEVWMSV